ncbi:DNA polymerase III subunit beta [Bradyrhizobium sp. URHD0069]|uniref:DNA polymerase III subunit beta n=1 Tax=Bradyrhizobium sp. URHD0069 TaxID=1380355 RepID=UPI0004950E0B|nr:DNA polymerase III subunit beta [Bradyrhizobium sp. URHD0069]
MKIVAHAGTLATALALAAAARPNKKTPALGAVRIVASEGALSVTCTSNSIAITAKTTAEIIEPGKAAIAADRLASLTSGFTASEKVTIGTDENLATIICGNSRGRLPLFPWDDLPAALAVDGEIGRIEISGADCLTLLEPLPAAASEVTRFCLCGIFWHSIDDRLVAVATDGVRLIHTCIAAGKFSEDRDLIVPREAAVALARLVKGTRPGKLTLRRSRTLLAVDGPAFTFVSRLIDGKYPVYEAVIPPASRTSATFVRAELLSALSRLAAVATVEPPLLVLSFDGSSDLNVFLARQPDDGSDLIAAEATGSAKVAVAPSQLAAMLSEFSSMHLRIEAATGQPIVIRGDGEKLALISQCAWNFNRNEKEEAA